MIEVPLSAGRYRQPSGWAMRVDDRDADLVTAHKWRLFKGQKRLYAVTGDGTLAHRLVADAPHGVLVDHVNDDGLDNRRANLVVITPSQAVARAWSRAVLSHQPTSKYRGVSLVPGRTKPWRAAISVNSHQQFLGYFASEVLAAQAYDHAAREHFGAFAHVNFGIEE
jgi:HNH endonuclease